MDSRGGGVHRDYVDDLLGDQTCPPVAPNDDGERADHDDDGDEFRGETVDQARQHHQRTAGRDATSKGAHEGATKVTRYRKSDSHFSGWRAY